jgi:hypothetical protein
MVSNHKNPGSALGGAEELIRTGGSGWGIEEVMSIQRASVSPFKKPQILKISSSVSYHNAPCKGFLGAAALKYTGADEDVGTLTASHCTPVHFQDLPLNVYTWPRVGFDGKLYAINQRAQHSFQGFTPLQIGLAYKKGEVSLPESSNDTGWNVELELLLNSAGDFTLRLNPYDESRLHGVTP